MKLTEAQARALDWHYTNSRRRWYTEVAGDPPMSSLMSLVRRKLSRKFGSAGWPISFELTEEGFAARTRLDEQEGRGR